MRHGGIDIEPFCAIGIGSERLERLLGTVSIDVLGQDGQDHRQTGFDIAIFEGIIDDVDDVEIGAFFAQSVDDCRVIGLR